MPPAYDKGQTDEGRAFLYLGSVSGLSRKRTREGNQGGAGFDTSVGAARDVNGDGYGDVIGGALYYDNGQTDEGRAFVYLGGHSVRIGERRADDIILSWRKARRTRSSGLRRAVTRMPSMPF